jgi:tetratricopeptide (TPR) repeat protein
MTTAELLLREAADQYNAGRPEAASALCRDILTADSGCVPALHLAAVIAFADKRSVEGTGLLGRVFDLDPDYVPALATLGDALAMKAEHDAAVAVFQRATGLQPEDAGLHAKLGVAYSDLMRFAEAETSYRHALDLNPGLPQTHFNLGFALMKQGRIEEAEEAYRDAIASEPLHRDAWLNLGNVLSDQNRLEDAVTAYNRALACRPDASAAGDAMALANLGSCLTELGRLDEAVEACESAIAVDPDHAYAYANLGAALHAQGKFKDAVAALRRAIAIEPANVKAHANLGAALPEVGEFDEAIKACERAISLDPNYAPAHTHHGIALDRQGDFAASVAAHRQAVVADPGSAIAHTGLAVALGSVGELDEALATSHRAVTLAPANPEVRFNHAQLLLMNGHFESGFDDLRWIRKCRLWAHSYPSFNEPEWQGDGFAGRTLLLFSDAGLGDTIQFVRYLPMVAAKGGKVVLQVQPTLVRLLRTMTGVTMTDVMILPHGEPLPRFDMQLPLMHLPHIFGTTLDSVPADVPYLHADPAQIEIWRSSFRNVAALKVGVVCAGNPRHKGDRHRSLAAEAVLPRLTMPGVQLYSLQKEPRPTDVPVLARLGADVIDLAPALGDFTDTAAAIAALDLVISVDTSVAHLAGAMGRPVWMLLPYALDWRWLRDREDSPWYPSLRLFRQQQPQAWDGVLTRVAAELARTASAVPPAENMPSAIEARRWCNARASR